MWPRYNRGGGGGGMFPQNQHAMQMLQNKMHKQHRFNNPVRSRFHNARPPYENKNSNQSVNSAPPVQNVSKPVGNQEPPKKVPSQESPKNPTTPGNKPVANSNNPNVSSPSKAPAAVKTEVTTPIKPEAAKNNAKPSTPANKPPVVAKDSAAKGPTSQTNTGNSYQPKPNQYQQNQNKPNQYHNQNQYPPNQNKNSQYNQNQSNQYQQNKPPPNQNNKPYQQNKEQGDNQHHQTQNKPPYQPNKGTYSQNPNPSYDHAGQGKDNHYQNNGNQSKSDSNKYEQKPYDNKMQPDSQQKPYPNKAWHTQPGAGGSKNDSWNRSDSGNYQQGSNSYNNNYDNKPYRGGAGPGPYNQGMRAGGYHGSDRIREKLVNTIYGPLTDLPNYDTSEKKFNVFAKLFVGNIPKNAEEEDVLALFREHGEIGPVYFSREASFGFITFDYKANAAKAVKAVDNKLVRNRPIKVRFATINEGIRVKNLSNYVSNELLEKAFSIFGQVENCRVVVDDRGTPKNEGVVLFKEKRSAAAAIAKCAAECFFLSGSLRPVVVTAMEAIEDPSEGYPEELIPRDEEYRTEREVVPHFADPGSFEQDFGSQWIKLFSMYDEKKAILDRDFKIEIERLEKKMVLARVEFETEKLRKELAQREAETAQLRRHFSGAEELPPHYPSGAYGAGDAADGAYDSSYGASYDAPYGDRYDGAPADYDMGYGDKDSFSNYKSKIPYNRNAGGYGSEPAFDPAFEPPSDVAPIKRTMPPPGYDKGFDSQPKVPNKRPRY